MSKEVSQQVLDYYRLRNTYSFSVESTCGDLGNGINDDPGNFDVLIPPFPFPDHNRSQRAIFTLKEFWVINQGNLDAERVSADGDFDPSGFVVQVNGLGMNNGYGQSINCKLRSAPVFTVINKYATIVRTTLGADALLQRNAGGEYYGGSRLCSNPVGSMINVNVRSLDTDAQIGGTGASDFRSLMVFTIELLDSDTSTN